MTVNRTLGLADHEFTGPCYHQKHEWLGQVSLEKTCVYGGGEDFRRDLRQLGCVAGADPLYGPTLM
jgi:hypothetical protein